MPVRGRRPEIAAIFTNACTMTSDARPAASNFPNTSGDSLLVMVLTLIEIICGDICFWQSPAVSSSTGGKVNAERVKLFEIMNGADETQFLVHALQAA